MKISDENQRSLHIFQGRKKLFRFEYTSIFILIIKMRGCEIDHAPVDVHLGADETTPLSFALIQIKMVISGSDWIARKNRDPVLPALVFQVERERVIHARQLCEFGYLINAPGALDAAIDFLQTDKIRMLLLNHVGDAREVQLAPRPAWWPAADGDATALAYWRGGIAATVWMADTATR